MFSHLSHQKVSLYSFNYSFGTPDGGKVWVQLSSVVMVGRYNLYTCHLIPLPLEILLNH